MWLPKHLLDRLEQRCQPISAILEVTARCNWRCPHCFVIPTGARRRAELTRAEVCRALDEMRDLGVFMLSVTGGEPTLRPDLEAILRRAVKNGMAVSLMSNLSHVDARRAARLAGIGLVQVQCTIFGATAATHDAVTGKRGSHAAAWRGVDELQRRGVNLVIKTPVMRANAAEVGALHAQVAARGLLHMASPVLLPRFPGDQQVPRLRLSDAEMTRVLAEQLDWLRAESAADAAPPGEDGAGGRCSAGTSIFALDADGAVRPCQTYPETAGNIRERSLAEIWRDSPLLAELRQATRARAAAPAAATHCYACSACEEGAPRAPSREFGRIGACMQRAVARRPGRTPAARR